MYETTWLFFEGTGALSTIMSSYITFLGGLGFMMDFYCRASLTKSSLRRVAGEDYPKVVNPAGSLKDPVTLLNVFGESISLF
jgi:hypothetical protein